MAVSRDGESENKMFLALIGVIVTGLVFQYRLGISGNDFWWHLRAGEWIVSNHTIPKIGIFSWYALENGIKWISHEWLSEIAIYLIYSAFGDGGFFCFSLFAALGLALIILIKNKEGIAKNFLLSLIYFLPIVLLFPVFFYGRPQLFSNYLFYFTLLCLFRYRIDETSKSIYLLPIISALWSNIHGGSSNLPYILCLIFLLSGLFEFSYGKIYSEKLSSKQIKTHMIIFILSILMIALNPHGFQMIAYPYINIGDPFLQQVIFEWQSPDAKVFFDLLYYYYPIVFVYLMLIISDKKIKLVDLIICLFFSYLALRSIRFSILFYITSTFFTFDYFVSGKTKPMKQKQDILAFYTILAVVICINIFSGFKIVNKLNDGMIISRALNERFVVLVQRDSPKRLYNDYNFGETLIYHNIDTFVDARADIFAAHNLNDAVNLLHLKQTNDNKKIKGFDAEEIITQYDFDAFLIASKRSLVTYLKSHPEKYNLIFEDNNAVYFKRIDN